MMDNKNSKRLHAYWRIPYVEKQSHSEKDSNPFKDLKDADEQERHIIIKGTLCCVLLNKYPYNAGHLLVLPYREIADISELSGEEQIEFMELIIKGKKRLSDVLSPSGFNVGFNLGKAGGAGIPKHLHCHIVPRWEGDHNFMPVISDTRVLPDSLENMWHKLKEQTQEIE
jgi:ATP adenylyltransferase